MGVGERRGVGVPVGRVVALGLKVGVDVFVTKGVSEGSEIVLVLIVISLAAAVEDGTGSSGKANLLAQAGSNKMPDRMMSFCKLFIV